MCAPPSVPASRFQNVLFYVVIVASSGARSLLTKVPKASQLLCRFIPSANLSEVQKTSTMEGNKSDRLFQNYAFVKEYVASAEECAILCTRMPSLTCIH